MSSADNALCTPLHYAALAGNPTIAKMLLRAGASLPETEWSVDATDVHGCTALHHAAAYGSVKVLAVLLHAGASTDIQTKHGATALHYAAANGLESVVRRLLRAGANPSAFDDNRTTPVHVAAFYSNPGAVRALLSGGAKRDVSDSSGLSVVDAVRATQDPILLRRISESSDFRSPTSVGDDETDSLEESSVPSPGREAKSEVERRVDLFDLMTVNGEIQARDLAVSLCRDKTLRGLDLSGSKFGARGLAWIFEALQVSYCCKGIPLFQEVTHGAVG